MSKTIEQIKEELPEIEITYNDIKCQGQIKGRKNDYASVYIKKFDMTFEYAWETVTRMYNEQNS
jgi:hypothetical protein